MQVVETAVAQKHHLARDGEMKRIYVTVVVNSKVHVKIGVTHVGVLHVDEKLLVQMVIEGVYTFHQAL